MASNKPCLSGSLFLCYPLYVDAGLCHRICLAIESFVNMKEEEEEEEETSKVLIHWNVSCEETEELLETLGPVNRQL